MTVWYSRYKLESATDSFPNTNVTHPKRHHYLPQFYLDGFCREGRLWVYDREAGETRIQTPINTGVKQYYYRFEYEDGEQSFEVEEFLSQVESGAAPAIEKLRRQEPIDDDERGVLAFFLGTLFGRTPSAEKKHDKTMDALIRARQKRQFPTPDSLRAFFDENPKLAEKVGEDVDFDSLCEFIQGDDYDLDIHRNESIKAMMLVADDVAPAYFELDWHILRPSDDRKSFITTDTPVIHAFTKPPEFTKLGPNELPDGIQVVAPLAHDCLLILENDMGIPGFEKLGEKDVRSFNLTLAAAADRFIIGSDKALVESVAAAGSRELYVSRDFDEALEIALEAAKEADEG